MKCCHHVIVNFMLLILELPHCAVVACDAQQAKLAKRAALHQRSFTDSMASRRLSNTSTIIGSAALPDTVTASEAGDTGSPLTRPSQSQSELRQTQSSHHSAQQPQPEQQAAAAAAAATDGSVGAGAGSSSSGPTVQQRPHPKASFSFGMRQGSSLLQDRQESCQLVLGNNPALYEHQQEGLQQQELPYPLSLQSRQQLEQQHQQQQLDLRNRSQAALQLQQQQQRQQDGFQDLHQKERPAPHAQVASPKSGTFGSPFSSADRLPEASAGSAAAAAADFTTDDAAAYSGHARDSCSSAESARMARQATLSAMLRMPSSALASWGGSGPDSPGLTATRSAEERYSATEAPYKGPGGGSSSSSNLMRLYRSSSSSKVGLPTLFEGRGGAGSPTDQQQQLLPPPPQPGQGLVPVGSGGRMHSMGSWKSLGSAGSVGVRVGRAMSDMGGPGSGALLQQGSRYLPQRARYVLCLCSRTDCCHTCAADSSRTSIEAAARVCT